MKKIYTLIFSLLSFGLYAQQEFSSFTATGNAGATTFVTDYQALGINPANLGWTWEFEEKKFAFGLSEMTYSLHSESLSKQSLRDDFMSMIKGDTEDFTWEEKRQAGQDFANSGFALNIDATWIGMALTTKSLGGFGFRINERFQWYSQLNETASEILFMGYKAPYFDSLLYVDPNTQDTSVIANYQNMDSDSIENIIRGFAANPNLFSDILEGSEVSMQWSREYNVSYGKKLFGLDSAFALYGGVGIKYFQGVGIMHITAEDGKLTAFSSLSPFFDIDYGTAAQSNPSSMSQDGGGLPKTVGDGWGFDLGLNAVLMNKLKIGLAFNNMGSIVWDGNVYTARDTLLYDSETEGLNSYNIFKDVDEFLGEDGLFKWEGKAKKKVKLPSTFRMGASMVITDGLEIGTDVIIPSNNVPGNFEKAIVGFGGDYQALPWLQLSAGFITGGNYGFNIPVGLLFRTPGGTWEAGIASRDAISFFVNNGPTISFSTGFLRFRI